MTDLLETTVSNFHSRPYRVIHARPVRQSAFQDASSIQQGKIGSVVQLVDPTDVLCWNDALKSFNEPGHIETD